MESIWDFERETTEEEEEEEQGEEGVGSLFYYVKRKNGWV